jgi:hypothetical protein
MSFLAGLRGLGRPDGYSWVAVVDVRRQYGRQTQEFEAAPYCLQVTYC